MDVLKAKTIHFVGIGGAGMSPLAQLLHSRGIHITGSDGGGASKTSALLEKNGIQVFFTHETEHVGEADVLIYTDAIPEDNPERVAARERGIPEYSYFTALGQVSKEYRTVAIAGTHGKTTTTAMLAGIARTLGDPTVIVGSIMSDTGTNAVIGTSDTLIVEACEYRDHFLNLSPDILVVTNIEFDHTDYFKDFAQLMASFGTLVKRLPSEGALIVDTSTEAGKHLAELASCKVLPYQDVSVPTLRVPGSFNIQNAQAAKAAASVLFPDAAPTELDVPLASFSGTWRRFEYRGSTERGTRVYDDYAHHPTAVQKTLEAAREFFEDKKIVVAFHPHLYSRTRDFMQEFAEALTKADAVYIAPIFPAREVFDGVTTNTALVEAVRSAGGTAEAISEPEDLQAVLGKYEEDTVFFTMGAGNIYTWLPELASS